MTTDKIKAAKHFGIEKFSTLRIAALKIAMGEMQKFPECRDGEKIRKMCERFRIGDAFAFYSQRPEFYW